MSFDAFPVPAAPQPAISHANSSPGADPAPAKLDRSGGGDRKENFVATLNRVSERKSGGHDRSAAADRQTGRAAKSHHQPVQPERTDEALDQDGVPGRAVESEPTESIPETPLGCDRPLMDLYHMLFADDGALPLQDPTHPGSIPTPADWMAVISQIRSEGQTPVSNLPDIGPVERLQADISPQASRLSFLRHLLNRAIVHHFVSEPSGHPADDPISAFWQHLTSMPVEGDSPDGQSGSLANRVDGLIRYLLQRMDHSPLSSELTAPAGEADGKPVVVNEQALSPKEDACWQKILRAAQPAGSSSAEMSHSANATKNSQLPLGSAKTVNADTLLESPPQKDVKPAEPAGPQSATKSVEPAFILNTDSGDSVGKIAQETTSLKPSGLPNNAFAAHQTASTVARIDGEAKDSAFGASQESLPEHLAKLEHAGRSANGPQRSLAAQTMNQIVQKAVLLNANGKNSIQIDLKPEFLGHIRMQIVTESHQVAVRIVAEMPVVRDMLESNLNQLKAELQSQGLEVDELEVSVAHDSRADDDLHQKAAEARRTRTSRNSRLAAEGAAEEQNAPQPPRSRGLTETAIDFFA